MLEDIQLSITIFLIYITYILPIACYEIELTENLNKLTKYYKEKNTALRDYLIKLIIENLTVSIIAWLIFLIIGVDDTRTIIINTIIFYVHLNLSNKYNGYINTLTHPYFEIERKN